MGCLKGCLNYLFGVFLLVIIILLSRMCGAAANELAARNAWIIELLGREVRNA